MSVINADTKAAWQAIADDLSKQRPHVGRRVRIDKGKHKGKYGIVQNHMRDKFDRSAFRYGGDASHHMTEMAGREGFVCFVRFDDGSTAFIKAHYTFCDPEE